jgi:hypothetical protein
MKPEWTWPYIQENFTGPMLSNGKFQESVADGSAPTMSLLDELSREHDTAYFRNKYSKSGRRAADLKYYEKTRTMSTFPQLAGNAVKYINNPETLGSAFPAIDWGVKKKKRMSNFLPTNLLTNKVNFPVATQPDAPLSGAWGKGPTLKIDSGGLPPPTSGLNPMSSNTVYQPTVNPDGGYGAGSSSGPGKDAIAYNPNVTSTSTPSSSGTPIGALNPGAGGVYDPYGNFNPDTTKVKNTYWNVLGKGKQRSTKSDYLRQSFIEKEIKKLTLSLKPKPKIKKHPKRKTKNIKIHITA